ncbi:MAG TPA: N-acetylmuramoyl-L-alanine amidase [Arenimonas sp.]|nr:N-acetylmuramoyl-L-alanine amidase [Arenimonas sp.]
MRRISALALSLAAFAGLSAASAQAAQLRGLSLVEGEDGTRAVLELSGPADYKLFTLANPDRLVLDLSRSSLAGGFKPPAPNGVVSGVRTGKPAEGDLRVVFDLGRGVQPRSRLEREGDSARLVVELLGNAPALAGKPAPARTVEDVIGKGERKLIVAIDAGHGGKDPGAIGPTRKFEKDITLAMARELAKQVNADPGMQAYLVRDGDVFIPLHQRYQRAREAQADLFISIHADAAENTQAQGATVYTLSETASDREAARLAARENKADILNGVNLGGQSGDVSSILIDLTQRESLNISASFARLLQREAAPYVPFRSSYHRFASLMVLKAPDTPSILFETGYISNADDAAFLSSREGQSKIARGVARAIEVHFARKLAMRGRTAGG